jgi:hypothetical protein
MYIKKIHLFISFLIERGKQIGVNFQNKCSLKFKRSMQAKWVIQGSRIRYIGAVIDTEGGVKIVKNRHGATV